MPPELEGTSNYHLFLSSAPADRVFYDDHKKGLKAQTRQTGILVFFQSMKSTVMLVGFGKCYMRLTFANLTLSSFSLMYFYNALACLKRNKNK